MTIKRCEHCIKIHADFLKHLIAKNGTYGFEDVKTRITFVVDMSIEDKKELASWLIAQTAVSQTETKIK